MQLCNALRWLLFALLPIAGGAAADADQPTRPSHATPATVATPQAVTGSAPQTVTASAAAPDVITVTDFAGRELRLDKPARRIVALAPDIVENLFAAGAGHHIVGATDYSNYPEAARHIARVGSFANWSIETVMALQPDLVVLWGSGNGLASLPRFMQLGVPIYVSELRQPGDIAKALRDFGTLAGTHSTATLAAHEFEQSFAALGAPRRDPVSVFYQVWNQPLQTVNGDHMISRVVSHCGGRNIFSGVQTLAPTVSMEAVLVRKPQVIIASGMDGTRPDWLDDWQRYRSLPAVQQRRVFYLDPNIIQRPTPRLLQGTAEICRMLSQAPDGATRNVGR